MGAVDQHSTASRAAHLGHFHFHTGRTNAVAEAT